MQALDIVVKNKVDHEFYESELKPRVNAIEVDNEMTQDRDEGVQKKIENIQMSLEENITNIQNETNNKKEDI